MIIVYLFVLALVERLLRKNWFNFDHCVDGCANSLLCYPDWPQVRQRWEQHFLLVRVHAQETNISTVRHETLGNKLEKQRTFAPCKILCNFP